jgi:hypothetical protein
MTTDRDLWVNSLGEIGLDDDLVSLAELEGEHRAIVEMVYSIQDEIDDGRFRAYFNEGKCLLTTEFVYPTNRPRWRRELERSAASLGAELWVMGEFDGETQVSMDWPVTSAHEAKAKKAQAADQTQELWERFGNCVI